MKRNKYIHRLLAGLILGIFLVFLSGKTKGAPSQVNRGFKNIMVIGWGGTQRNHLWELIDEGKLKNLSGLIKEGKCVDIHIDTGITVSKPGWAKILSGYDAEITGVYHNKKYKPIPEGYTVFERLKKHFGDKNITTVLMGAIQHNLGIRGPHRICLNCKRNIQGLWWDEELSVLENPNDKKVLKEMVGEPYFNAAKSIDIYNTGLGEGDNVGKAVLETLEKIKDKRFFFFVQFYDADTAGHLCGENSKEYSEGIMLEDKWLGRIISKLKELKIYDNTLIYVTTNNGFIEDEKEHWNSRDIWLVTNDKMVKKDNGEIRDIAPTILKRFGLNLDEIKPKLQGTPLL